MESRDPSSEAKLFSSTLGMNLLPGITKNLSRALGRLIYAAADIPVAYLETKAAGIRQRSSIKLEGMLSVARRISAGIAEGDPRAQPAMDYFLQDLMSKQDNREKIVRGAIDELAKDNSQENKNTVEDIDEIDDDWLNFFAEHSQTKSNHDIQDLWSKILAGEIRKPGSFSLHTLHFLARCSKNDALVVTRLARYVINDFIPSIPDIFDFVKIEDVMYFESLGLISSFSPLAALSKSFKSNREDSFECVLLSHDKGIVLSGPSKLSHDIPAMILSPVAQDLISLGKFEADEKYLEYIARKIKKELQATLVFAHRTSHQSVSIRFIREIN